MIVPAAAFARTAAAKDTSVWVAIGSAMHKAEMLAQLTSEAHSGRLRACPSMQLESAGVLKPRASPSHRMRLR